MKRLQEIEARLAEIAADIEKRGAELDAEILTAYTKEVDSLKEERAGLLEAVEQRKNLLNTIAENRGGGNVIHSFEPEKSEVDAHDTPEYRKAFMEYVCRGVAFPAELRAAEVTTVADAGIMVPTTTLNEIIKKLNTYGNIYTKVRKMNIQGGVRVPVMTLKPEATWIGEGAASDDKKIAATEHIEFSYYSVECKIAQTLLANVVTFDAFQREFVPLATEAVIRAIERTIFVGTGSGQPTGITTDRRVPAANTITLTAAEFGKWDVWKKKVFAKMKKAYRNGIFVMAQGTFDGYIDGMVDANGQPIGRVNYGMENGESYRFGGKVIETVEDDIIIGYDEAAAGDVVAIFFDPNDYAINTNLQMNVVKWQDHDANTVKNKCTMICDGKLLDPHGVLIIKKGA